MAANDLKKLIGIARKDRALQSAVSSATDYDSMVASIVASAKVHGLDVNRKDVDKAVLELNRIQNKPSDSVRPTAEQERLLATSLAGFCLDFPPTTDWTNVAKPGNPCGPSALTTESS